jgi:hypothetical protein
VKVETFFNVFGIIVLAMLLIFLASSGGQQVIQTGPGSLASASSQFFTGFKSAVG